MKTITATVIATLQLLLVACESGPEKPTTHTPAPALNESQQLRSQVSNRVVDAKDSFSRAQRLNQQIEDKVIMLRDMK